MQTIDVDGVTLTYDVEGPGGSDASSGVALAFVHGWCSKSAHWDPQANHFRPTRRVLRWDRRGMGRAAGAEPAKTARRHADDLALMLGDAGINEVVVVGHAGGGPAALEFAVHHADRTRGLILVDTALHEAPQPGEVDWFGDSVAGMIAQLEGPHSDAAFEALYRSFFGPLAPSAVVDDAVANALAGPRDVAVTEVLHMLGDTVSLARAVRCPTLWVRAEDADAKPIAKVFDDVMIGRVVGSGHFPQLEVPGQVNAMMETFLAGICSVRAIGHALDYST